jgi:hypothetical protein
MSSTDPRARTSLSLIGIRSGAPVARAVSERHEGSERGALRLGVVDSSCPIPGAADWAALRRLSQGEWAAPASGARPRSAGSRSTVGSTSSTSTTGTGSGRSPGGASPAGHRRAGATTLRESPMAQYGPCFPLPVVQLGEVWLSTPPFRGHVEHAPDRPDRVDVAWLLALVSRSEHELRGP